MKRLISLLLVALTLWSLAFPALAMNLETPKHPSTARMRVRPKLGEGVDLNLYRYCGNNPTNFIDPDGLQLVQTTTALGALAGATAAYFGTKALINVISTVPPLSLPNIPPPPVNGQNLINVTSGVSASGGLVNVTPTIPDMTILGGSIITVQPLVFAQAKNDGKKNKDDAPVWVEKAYAGGDGMLPGESQKQFLKRIFSEQYPGQKINTGPGEYGQAKKYLEQKCRNRKR